MTPKDITNHFRGGVIYCAENEAHFPHLTVGDTLEFATKLRTPQNRPEGVSREDYMDHMTKVVMACRMLLIIIPAKWNWGYFIFDKIYKNIFKCTAYHILKIPK